MEKNEKRVKSKKERGTSLKARPHWADHFIDGGREVLSSGMGRSEESDGEPAGEAVETGVDTASGIAGNGSSEISRRLQKKKLKKAAIQKSREEKGMLEELRDVSEKVAKAAGEAFKGLGRAAAEHPGVILSIGGVFLLVGLLSALLSSCSVLAGGSFGGSVGASFTAEDGEIEEAEAFYQGMEAELQEEFSGIEKEYPGYDEYNYESDEIGHNPFPLMAFLTVRFEDFKAEEVRETLRELFNAQYELETEEVTETRTRKEEQEVVNRWVDKKGKIHEEKTQETVEVPYEYRILKVKLTNRTLETVISGLGMTEEEADRYYLLLTTGGNRSELFAGNPYAFSTEGLTYDIPGEALSDQRFARMVKTGEKYLGYPYVWGGSSPSTSFDCSGFVSWVLNHCGNGWEFGRLTAEELREECSIIKKSQAKPGDLVFFQGTYATSGASHVGIYVGNGMMLHCGNPIQYASFETEYWERHFYCFGRLP